MKAQLPIVRALRFARDLLALLANHKSDQDELIAPSGGVYNYRTEELDDGTDPRGWYGKY